MHTLYSVSCKSKTVINNSIMIARYCHPLLIYKTKIANSHLLLLSPVTTIHTAIMHALNFQQFSVDWEDLL